MSVAAPAGGGWRRPSEGEAGGSEGRGEESGRRRRRRKTLQVDLFESPPLSCFGPSGSPMLLPSHLLRLRLLLQIQPQQQQRRSSVFQARPALLINPPQSSCCWSWTLLLTASPPLVQSPLLKSWNHRPDEAWSRPAGCSRRRSESG